MTSKLQGFNDRHSRAACGLSATAELLVIRAVTCRLLQKTRTLFAGRVRVDRVDN